MLKIKVGSGADYDLISSQLGTERFGLFITISFTDIFSHGACCDVQWAPNLHN